MGLGLGLSIDLNKAAATAVAVAPSNSVAPVISGTNNIGQVLTTTDGTWTGTPAPTFAYQWFRGATAISGQTATTYTIQSQDLHPTAQAITCQVTGTNASGTAVATSNIITPVILPFAFTAKTDNPGVSTWAQFKLPLTTSTGLNAVVDWGDATTSTITSHTSPDITHTYATAGTYSISITGTLPGWQFNNGGDRRKILNISSWGVLDITTNAIFRGCTNLTSNATDAPTITTTDLSFTFRDCTNFNGNVGNWDVSGVTYMAFMFSFAWKFNNGGSSSIGSWNTSSNTNMTAMFSGTTAFNQPIGTWNTALVNDMSYMFSSATNFNQNISSWNTALVNNMASMFNNTPAFNQNISSWNTGAVTTMVTMFQGASAFNQPIGSWNTALVTTMSSMFSSATVFNQSLSFNTALVNNMSTMFQYATAFNQPLSFNTGAVTNMSGMFQGATAFQQNIGSWNVANVTNFANFMSTKTAATFSTTNLDAIYNGWVTVQSSKTISFGSAKYSASGTAGRNYLTGTKLWTITDGGL
jgi:surface protein